MIYPIKWIAYFIIGRIHCIKNPHIKIKHGARVTYSSKLEGYNVINENSYFRGEIGLGSYIGPDSLVIGKIGRFCSIARNVLFLESTHPTSKFVSSHPAFYSLGKQCGITFVAKQKFDEKPKLEGNTYPFEVGNDVYIGAGVTVIGPVRIGDGAVIAANATVIHDVAPYSIVAGTPAKEIRKRFCDSDIEYLMKTKWWEKSLDWLIKNGECMESINELKKVLGDGDEK